MQGRQARIGTGYPKRLQKARQMRTRQNWNRRDRKLPLALDTRAYSRVLKTSYGWEMYIDFSRKYVMWETG